MVKKKREELFFSLLASPLISGGYSHYINILYFLLSPITVISSSVGLVCIFSVSHIYDGLISCVIFAGGGLVLQRARGKRKHRCAKNPSLG